ncbi:hypothetical protein TWF718_001536 [Orbilia javanica]|uniref:Uncharacterized protein n=1 Tax=Orbilia javanica TaxID=47235 RepID=A0AAN8N8T2_9PEZI
MNAPPHFQQSGAAGGEPSSQSDESAANILFGMREEITNNAHVSPTAHLAPVTYEQLLYDTYKKLPNKIKIPALRMKLGIPVSNRRNDRKWSNLSDCIDELSRQFDFYDDSIENMTEISGAIEGSAEWKDCSPDSPAAVFVPALIYRWKRNRIDRPKCNLQKKANLSPE